jgi:hypothetical protein
LYRLIFLKETVMQAVSARLRILVALLAAMGSGPVLAKLPPLTPEQEQAAAAKKQQAAEQAAREKQQLAAAMDRLAARWRERAAANGWNLASPTPVAAILGFNTSAAQSSGSGQPGGQLGEDTDDLRIRSEKRGTAPASEDVKNPAEKGK